MSPYSFSAKLTEWLKSKSPKTIAGLDDTFAEKSFAVAFLLLMATSALPIPTGGITNVFEVITLILAVEMIAGRRTLWLPERWRHTRLSNAVEKKAMPKVIGFVRWFERLSRPRMSGLMQQRQFIRVLGVIVFGFTLAALAAPPFSGLDTLPSLGVILISLSLLLEDVAIFIGGMVVGVAGIILQISLGTAVFQLISKFFV